MRFLNTLVKHPLTTFDFP